MTNRITLKDKSLLTQMTFDLTWSSYGYII